MKFNRNAKSTLPYFLLHCIHLTNLVYWMVSLPTQTIPWFNQTTKENGPNIWLNNHIQPNSQKKKKKKKSFLKLTMESGTVWMLNLAKENRANFWLTLTFILVRKHYMITIVKYCMANLDLLEKKVFLL